MAAKPTVLLLHGATGSAADLHAVASHLQQDFNVYAPDFPGHGGELFEPPEYSIGLFAEYIKKFLSKKNLLQPVVFGYSMGGYVALYLERKFPGTFNRIITLGTKFLWNEAIAARECGRFDPRVISEKLPAFATALREMHGPGNWEEVLRRTANMMTAMGHDSPLKGKDLAVISAPVLLMLGDSNKMVTLDDTRAVSEQLPKGRLCILPGTPHAIAGADARLVAEIIRHGRDQ